MQPQSRDGHKPVQMQSESMSPMKTKSKQTRYTPEQRKAILVFMKTNSNEATKKKFGCSAHWAGALRRASKSKKGSLL